MPADTQHPAHRASAKPRSLKARSRNAAVRRAVGSRSRALDLNHDSKNRLTQPIGEHPVAIQPSREADFQVTSGRAQHAPSSEKNWQKRSPRPSCPWQPVPPPKRHVVLTAGARALEKLRAAQSELLAARLAAEAEHESPDERRSQMLDDAINAPGRRFRPDGSARW
jgi:hypothetical protein